jgi:hypothetical protein
MASFDGSSPAGQNFEGEDFQWQMNAYKASFCMVTPAIKPLLRCCKGQGRFFSL